MCPGACAPSELRKEGSCLYQRAAPVADAEALWGLYFLYIKLGQYLGIKLQSLEGPHDCGTDAFSKFICYLCLQRYLMEFAIFAISIKLEQSNKFIVAVYKEVSLNDGL